MIDLRSIATQLVPTPIYLVLRSDGVPDNLVSSRRCAGMFHRQLHLGFQQWLVSRGEWVGRLPCIFVDDRLSIDPLAIMCHELAHLVDAGLPGASGDSLPAASVSRFVSRTLTLPPSAHIDGDDDVSRSQHGASFVRLYCHLWFRAAQIGCRFDFRDAYDSELYGLTDISNSLSALGCEPEALASVSIFDIAGTSPPRPFQQLWNAFS